MMVCLEHPKFIFVLFNPNAGRQTFSDDCAIDCSPASDFDGVKLSPDFCYDIPAWGQLMLGKSCYHTSISGFLYSLSIITADSPILFFCVCLGK